MMGIEKEIEEVLGTTIRFAIGFEIFPLQYDEVKHSHPYLLKVNDEPCFEYRLVTK